MESQSYGIIPAMATPFTPDGELNEGALRQLTHHLTQGGVHGLFATGSQGEFWALTPEEKQRVWEVVLDEADGEVPVYAGTGAVTTREVVDLNRRAEGLQRRFDLPMAFVLKGGIQVPIGRLLRTSGQEAEDQKEEPGSGEPSAVCAHYSRKPYDEFFHRTGSPDDISSKLV